MEGGGALFYLLLYARVTAEVGMPLLVLLMQMMLTLRVRVSLRCWDAIVDLRETLRCIILIDTAVDVTEQNKTKAQLSFSHIFTPLKIF